MVPITPGSGFRAALRAWLHRKSGVPKSWAELFWLAMALGHAPGLVGAWRRATLKEGPYAAHLAHARQDPDLASLRELSEFKALLK